MRVYAFWMNRFAFLIVAGILVALFSYGYIVAELDLFSSVVSGSFFVLPLLLVSPRLIRGGVEGTESELIVRGWLWSRRIPLDAVDRVTEYRILWTSSGGKQRWTPLTLFWNGASWFEPLLAHNAHSLTKVRRWVRGHKRRSGGGVSET